MDYLKRLYVPFFALSLALTTQSCSIGAKDIEEAYKHCEHKTIYHKVRTTEGILTCEEIINLSEHQ